MCISTLNSQSAIVSGAAGDNSSIKQRSVFKTSTNTLTVNDTVNVFTRESTLDSNAVSECGAA